MYFARKPHGLLLLALNSPDAPPCAQPGLQEEEKESLAVGGQAVMEGIMMRNGDRLALAVRRPDGSIAVQERPWFSLTRNAFLKRPYLRGFPVLLETMVNGIKALNISAELAMEAEGEELRPWQLALTLAGAIGFAILLFVLLPHLLTIGLQYLNISSGVEGLSFHLWDGLIKFGVFLLYILAISRLPDIKRVFQYHGAEHKAIWAYESGADPVDSLRAAVQSRLHPRCGTTFLLFVLSISIVLHAVLLPGILLFWSPSGPVVKHLSLVGIKLLLMIPISSLAYELIRYAARLGDGIWAKALRAPGMLLQMLTTREPDAAQLDVALAALHAALGEDESRTIAAPAYTHLEPR